MSGGSMNYLYSRGEEVNTLCKAAKHMLEVADANQYAVANQAPHGDVMAYNAAVNNLRTALKQEEEASAWLAERKEHWRKEKEKIQATDPELSAALGWPGGISDPVLDRKVLLQMVAALRLASQQALEALGLAKLNGKAGLYSTEIEEISDAITNLRAALAEPEGGGNLPPPLQVPAEVAATITTTDIAWLETRRLTKLWQELGQMRWAGSDEGWDRAIEAVRSRLNDECQAVLDWKAKADQSQATAVELLQKMQGLKDD